MSDMHQYALELTLTPENWSADITVRSGIDGRVRNAGAKLYRKFNNKHLEPVSSAPVDADGILLRVRTCQSDIRLVQAARTRVFRSGTEIQPTRRCITEPGYIAQEFEIAMREGQALTLEKIVSLFTSRDQAISEAELAARKALTRAARFEHAMRATCTPGGASGAGSIFIFGLRRRVSS